jgi:ribosomal protein L4
MCLSDKVNNSRLIVVEDFDTSGKTKELASLRQILPGAGFKTMWLLDKKDEKIEKALRNLSQTAYKMEKDVNVVDLLSYPYIILTKKCVEKLEKRLS